MTVLDDAALLVEDGGERNKDYDHPAPNHERIALMWTAILGQSITPEQVVLCMIAVKLARLAHNPNHRDSWVDVAGYARVWERIWGEEVIL